MTNTLRFDDQVVLITGAGGGLGKSYALLFASRGAKVVVNDLGGKASGEGTGDFRAASLVVEEIRSKGGIAVADYNSVENGEKIVNTALEHFGRVDILVNNAGILRDRSFARISEQDWDMVLRVHLKGSFLVTKAVWPIMRKQGNGKIIMTSSTSGIYGNFGQANYGSAKLGILGLSNTLAIEGFKYNIHCNTVVPLGGTRLTEGLLPPELFNELKPKFVAPLVMWLCHNDCNENGGVFQAGGGWYGKYRWERTKGVICRKSIEDSVSPENVRDKWDQITSFSDSLHLQNQSEDAATIALSIEDLKDNDESDVKLPTENNTTGILSGVGVSQSQYITYETKDIILYALGVGISVKHSDGLKFLYEGHDDFCPLPTFSIIPVQDCVIGKDSVLMRVPGWTPDLTRVLHGEQYIEMLKPLPTFGTVRATSRIVEVLDKGTGSVVLIEADLHDEHEEHLANFQWVIFIVGDGNFGGQRNSDKLIPIIDPPPRRPDVIESFQTTVDQGAIYRLSGDKNPLHIDPNFSIMGGFKEPILHGLCSYGIAASTILKIFCKNDTKMFKSIKSRFSKPVIPGQTLVINMWQDKRRIFFEANVKETDVTCLCGGYVDLNSDPAENVLEIYNKLSQVEEKLLSMVSFIDKDVAKTFDGIFLWNLTVDGNVVRQWTFQFMDSVEIYKGYPKSGTEATCTISILPEDFLSLLNGTLNYSDETYLKRIKISGDLTHSVPTLLSVFIPKHKL